jgi:type IV secretion system protein VirD4
MARPVSPELPPEGLLVGWSLEGTPRKPLIGFTHNAKEGFGSQFLEPILHTGEGHLITVAPTGAGKGVGCIIPALLRYRGPVVVIDPKGENYAVTSRARREMGQRVIALDPFRITRAPIDEIGRFNPLDFLSPDNPSLVEDAEMIAATLASAAGPHKDPFWPYMGSQLLTLLLLYQLRRLPPNAWSLTKTRELLARSHGDWEKLGLELIEDRDPAIRRLAGLVLNPAAETFGGYWAFAQMQTGCFKGELVGECIDTSSFSLQELVDGTPLSIYIVIPPEKLEAFGNLLKVWLSVMIAALTHRRTRSERPTLFILDEAAQLGTMPQLRQAVTLLRGYGVRVWSFWQDLSQVVGLYPDTWQTLLNNCHVQQFFGQVTRLGAHQTYEVTGLGSPEYLQTLEPSEMVLSVLGDQPVIARVPSYLHDPPFAGRYDVNPYYQGRSEADAAPVTNRVFRRSRPDQAAADRFEATSALGRQLLRAQQFHPVSKQRWQTVEHEHAAELLRDVRRDYTGLDEVDDERIKLRRWPLSFYDGFDYYEITATKAGRREVGYVLWMPGEAIFLDGKTSALHGLNERLGLRLRKQQIQDYLFFFCSSVEGESGRFLIIDELDDLVFKIEPNEDYLEAVAKAIEPPSPAVAIAGADNEIRSYSIAACVLYGDTLFRARFVVHVDGHVAMTEDDELFGQMPVMKDAQLQEYRLRLRPRGRPRG